MPVLALVHTITADNGKEFAGHLLLAKTLSALFFFATPYHSWERGLNEHTNGLVRQYFPKSTDFKTLDPAEVTHSAEHLPEITTALDESILVYCAPQNERNNPIIQLHIVF